MISKQAGAISLWLISTTLFMPVTQAKLLPDQAQARTEELERIAASLDTLAESAAPADDLADATEQLDFEAESIIAFVRDDVRFEPYSGALKGARGCLSARLCNSLDLKF